MQDPPCKFVFITKCIEFSNCLNHLSYLSHCENGAHEGQLSAFLC